MIISAVIRYTAEMDSNFSRTPAALPKTERPLFRSQKSESAQRLFAEELMKGDPNENENENGNISPF